ncbi:MAG: VWA domain-containing protein [Planctomycetes bacterium]|nr:VWA domain-containing protein [Planctomycetota bacterium]
MSQLPKVKGIADIVFLLDATGSMGPCINAVKQNIKTFVQTLTTPTPNGAAVVKDWRAKVMGYRDLDYTDVPAIVDNPFVGSSVELEAQLDALKADGGGDEPETLLEALYMLANMPSTGPDEPLRPDAWRNVNSGRRFVIVFTDAPFKEPLRVPKDARIDDVILNLMTAKIVLHMFAPATLARFGTLEEVDKALWYKVPVNPGETAQSALEAYTADQTKFEKIIQLLAKTMTQQSGADTPSAD